MSGLNDSLGRMPHTVTARIDVLEALGLVRQVRASSVDRRNVLIVLTDTGTSKLSECQAALEAFAESLAEGRSIADMTTELRSTLTALKRILYQ